MIKDKTFYEELIWTDDFGEFARVLFTLNGLALPPLIYVEDQNCFYGYAINTYRDKQYRTKVEIEPDVTGKEDDLTLVFWAGDFTDEELTKWKNSFEIGRLRYKDQEWQLQ